jgi:hypothetical protein
VQKALNKYEQLSIGKHTFNKQRITIKNQAEGTEINRRMFINFCIANSLSVCNTNFNKPDTKLITYRHPGTQGPPYVRIEGKTQRYETLDYILIEDRWKNGVKDTESKIGANIETSHYPLAAKIKINFRAVTNENTEKKFQQFSKANKGEWANFNSALTTKRAKLDNSKEDNNLIMDIAEKTLTIESEQPQIIEKTEEIIQLEQDIKEHTRQENIEAHDAKVKQLGNLYKKLHKEDKIKSVGANIPDRDRCQTQSNMKKKWKKQNYIYNLSLKVYLSFVNEKSLFKLPKRAHVLFTHDVERTQPVFQPLQRSFVAETDLEILERFLFWFFFFVFCVATMIGLRKRSG